MTQPISVLHVLNSYADSSIARIVERIIRLADPFAFEWHVCAVKEFGDFDGEFRKHGIPVEHFASTPDKSDPPWKKVRDYSIQHDIQIIHSHTPRTILDVWRGQMTFPRGRGQRPYHVATKHLLTKPGDRKHGQLLSILDRLSLFLPDRLVPVSQAMARIILGIPGISATKVNPIPNAIPCGEYYQPESRESMREELGLDPSTIAIGFTGRLEKVKNLDLLLTAFRNIHLHWPDTRLVIAGEGDLMDALQKQSADLGLMNDVLWMGFYKDIPRLLSAMDLYIQPSINEGLSLSILEAMAAELPVISTKVDSATEIITDGANGMLIPPSSTRCMEDALRSLIENPEKRSRLANAGRKTVLENYDLPIMVDHYCQLYQNLITG